MKKIERVYVVGIGGIGAAYASKLYEMDPQSVSVIASDERRQRYLKNPVTVNSKPYMFKYILPQDDLPPADLMLVAVKYQQLQKAINDIKNYVGPNTIILSLLNGITSEEIIGRELGMEKMLYAVCMGIASLRDGNDVTCHSLGKIMFGEKNNEPSPRVKAVGELFTRAGIPHEIPKDIMRALWWKFMINVGINQYSAVLRAPYGVFLEIREARELIESAMHEVILLSEKVGVDLSEKDIHEYYAILKNFPPGGKTSTHQDIEEGRETEVEMFAGVVSSLGKQHGVPTPVSDSLYRLIRTQEKMAAQLFPGK